MSLYTKKRNTNTSATTWTKRSPSWWINFVELRIFVTITTNCFIFRGTNKEKYLPQNHEKKKPIKSKRQSNLFKILFTNFNTLLSLNDKLLFNSFSFVHIFH